MTQSTLYGKLTQAQFVAFLAHPLLARLSTAVPSKSEPGLFQPHTTPVWFIWEDGCLFISAFSSTRKVKELRRNPYIAVLVDVAEAIDGVSAALLEGKAEWIPASPFVQEMSRKIYTKYMGEEGVLAEAPQSWIVDAENSIIKLAPAHVYTW